MRLTSYTVLAIAAGLVHGANTELADVYLIRSVAGGQYVPQRSDDRDVPQLPRQIARQILLQRIGADHNSLLEDFPDSADLEQAISYINEYGRKSTSLFDRANSWGWAPGAPSQAVVVIEGVTAQNSLRLKTAMKQEGIPVSFTIRDPPSFAANRQLVDLDLRQGETSQNDCGIDDLLHPRENRCWKYGRFVATVDLKKSPKSLDLLASDLARLQSYPIEGDNELTIVLLPESSRASTILHWTTNAPSKLRARADSESVIFEGDPVGASSVHVEDKAQNAPNFRDFVAVKTAVPSCMGSFNSCVSITANCSGHGICRDRFAPSSSTRRKRAEGDAEPEVCFACHCYATLNRPEGEGGISTTQWAGNMCQKIDISVPFWLITGFTIVIIGALTGAVGLLYSVGEEKLPGVIGAGVSKPK